MGWLREFWEHAWGRDDDTPSADRTVEAGWVPAWQAQMLADELAAAGIPARAVDDYGVNLLVHAREPMARIFVTEDRRAEAAELLEALLGHPPRRRTV